MRGRNVTLPACLLIHQPAGHYRFQRRLLSRKSAVRATHHEWSDWQGAAAAAVATGASAGPLELAGRAVEHVHLPDHPTTLQLGGLQNHVVE